jgi:hypothetical protein
MPAAASLRCRPWLAGLLLAMMASARADNGARYLVIAYDSYFSAVQPLARWKTEKGVPAKVVRVSEIGNTPSQIQTYIRSAYNTWPVRPEYVLIVGAPSQIAASFTSPAASDDGYGDMSGDHQLELSVGRFWVSTPAECSTLVNKVLSYEKTPFASGDSTWMTRGTTIVNEDNPPDQYYQTDSRYIRDRWGSAGYTVTESLMDNWGHTSTHVRNAINNGRGFVTHRGQCVSNWWAPFDQVQPATLANGTELPVVVSGSCATLTLTNGTMLADQFVRAGTPTSLRGASAYFGTTYTGSHISLQRGTVTKAFFTAAFAEGRYKLGDACRRAKFLIDSLLNPAQQFYCEWNLLGDPEMPLWTGKVLSLAASYDSVIPVGNADLQVAVTRGPMPASEAVVCAMMDSTVYVVDTTDASGGAVLHIASQHEGTLLITVTAKNAMPFQGSAQVRATNAPYLTLDHHRLDDAQGGNGDGRANPGETIRLMPVLRNSGDSTAFAVSAVLTAGDTFTRLIDTLGLFGDIAPGDTAVSGDWYSFAVASGCTCAQQLSLALQIQDSRGRSWLSLLGLPVYAANIRYIDNLVNDPPPGGNGNGRIEPHEGLQLLVNLRNAGTEGLDAVSATLRTSSVYVSITDSTGSYGTMPAGASVTNSDDPFALSTSPSLPPGQPVLFTLAIRGRNGGQAYEREQNFAITPSSGAGSDPIGPDAYGYYCYDDTDTLSGQAPAFDWLELAPPGPGQLIPGITDSDNGLDTLSLPFTFRYYGQNFTDMTVASNGFACLGRTGYRGGTNVHIPNPDSARYRNFLPMWDDMNPDETRGGYGDYYYYYDAANHRWIEESYEVAHYWSQTTRETYQVILLDPAYYPTPTGDGEILYMYHTVGDPNYATVGIQDPSWSRAIQYEFDGVYHPNAATLANRRVLRFTTVPPAVSGREWLVLSQVGIDDSALGNGNGRIEPGEAIRLTLQLSNLSDSGAYAVQGTLRAGDGNSEVQDSFAVFGDIPGQGSAFSATPYSFRTASQPTESTAQFSLLLRSAASTGLLYFTLPLSIGSGVQAGPVIPLTQYSLAGSPSLSDGALTVRFGVPRSGLLDLAVFDVGGRRVRTLRRGWTGAGNHELRWNGRDDAGLRIAAGVYYVRLVGADGRQNRTQKLQIVR